ncbi:MAG: Na+/H+ antiporter NhaC family protein [Acidobacteriota bacterium]
MLKSPYRHSSKLFMGLFVAGGLLLGSPSPVAGQAALLARFEIDAPGLVLTGVPFELEIRALDAEGNLVAAYQGTPSITGVQLPSTRPSFEGGRLMLEGVLARESGRQELRVETGDVSATAGFRAVPGILSVLPPLFAITLALVFRQVVVSLFAGIWLGAMFLRDYNPVAGFFAVLDHFLVNALIDKSHAQIVLFSMLFGGMVGVISRNGGARGIAYEITRYAKTARGGQLASWGTALVLFFDDYANVLIRGNLMRPITDKLRVSREKLSFIVDTGAASVASIFVISTWIGYEVGLIEQGLEIIKSPEDPYTMFLRTIPYRFYPFLAMVLAFLIGWTGRDFGPMLAAERRARATGKVLRDGAQPATEVIDDLKLAGGEVPARWVNGLLPIASVLLMGFFAIYWTGTKALQAAGTAEYGLGEIVSSADSYVALLWAALTGCVIAMLLAISQRIMSLTETVDAWFQGLKAMLMAIVILLLAWSIGAVTEELYTADFLVQVLEGTLSPFWLPVLTFVIAAAMAFATGTSWATMAIMMPLVIPLAHSLSVSAGVSPADAETVLVGVISSVLAGAVFGDHCSPISDTTILSSMSSACDHIDHVRTQLPYALLAAVVGMVVGDIPSAYGLSPWISLLIGVAILAGVLFVLGEKVEEKAPAVHPAEEELTT